MTSAAESWALEVQVGGLYKQRLDIFWHTVPSVLLVASSTMQLSRDPARLSQGCLLENPSLGTASL